MEGRVQGVRIGRKDGGGRRESEREISAVLRISEEGDLGKGWMNE